MNYTLSAEILKWGYRVVREMLLESIGMICSTKAMIRMNKKGKGEYLNMNVAETVAVTVAETVAMTVAELLTEPLRHTNVNDQTLHQTQARTQ